MIIENKLTKKIYRRMVLRNELFGSKTSLTILVLYVILWRVTYTITKIGQLKTTIPLFLIIIFLILTLLIYKFIVYKRRMKKELFEMGSQIEMNDNQLTITKQTGSKIVLPLEKLIKIKENKKWFFLFFQENTFIPVSKDAVEIELFRQSIKGTKTKPLVWKPTVTLFALVTIAGMYFVGNNAVNFNGALAWKINEWKTDTKVKLKNDNFYSTKLTGIIDSVKSKIKLEPYLMTNDLEIRFAKDGTITSIETYIYGYDKNKKLQSGYLVYYDKTKSNKITVHKQHWNGEGTTKYEPDNDLSIVINMLNSIPVEDEVKQWNEDNLAVMYKGIRSWGYNTTGIHFIGENGKISIPSSMTTEIIGPTISLYIPGKENMITPKRYIFKP
ncbi:hypothetical protein B5V89_18915 [Heyndrickxia sporothermodurans]|uniref:YcxB family protein n=1 Tax=Heyndrickxia TaxID=2837504 RepID=UPI000D3B525B|nr:YcxB family protein [Heyndrickxia sporothermodurans]PTY76155.1 hypothetical protein B5V89_18915 [Heyndrickxia sporothermodurans]